MKNKHTYLSICFLCLFLSFFSVKASLSLNRSEKFVAFSSLKNEVKQSDPNSGSQDSLSFEEAKEDADIAGLCFYLNGLVNLKGISTVISNGYFDLFSHNNKFVSILVNGHSLRI